MTKAARTLPRLGLGPGGDRRVDRGERQERPTRRLGFVGGDVNGDGYADVIVGANTYDNGQADEGRAYVYLGSAAGLVATPAWTAESDRRRYSAISVATAGDINGDGYADVIVGAPLRQRPDGRGPRVRLSRLGAGLATTAALTGRATWQAPPSASVTTAGDVNGDGYADVIVGAPVTPAATGRSRIAELTSISGASRLATMRLASARGGRPSWRHTSAPPRQAGRCNGDGYRTSSWELKGMTMVRTEGRAYVYLGFTYESAERPRVDRQRHQSGPASATQFPPPGTSTRTGTRT